MKHPLADVPIGTVPHLINNFFRTACASDLPAYLDKDVVVAGDVDLCDRLIRAFWSAHNAESERIDRPNEGVWEMVKHEFHGPTYALLAARDAKGLADYLSNGLRETIAYGLGSGPATLEAIKAGNIENITLLRDRIVSLGVAVGTLPIENPEQGAYGANMNLPLREIVIEIERCIQAPLGRPPAMGNFGFRCDSGIIDFRAPEDAWAAHRLREYNSIAEIGGGFGGAAFQLFRNNHRVSIYDLPIMGVVQGFFLSKLAGNAVSLFGEGQHSNLKVLPWFCFENDASDVVFNRDSMAEFPRHSALWYLTLMKSRQVPFLSINQETQHDSGQTGVKQVRVASLANELGLQRRSRYPYWIRRGYVEELYL